MHTSQVVRLGSEVISTSGAGAVLVQIEKVRAVSYSASKGDRSCMDFCERHHVREAFWSAVCDILQIGIGPVTALAACYSPQQLLKLALSMNLHDWSIATSTCRHGNCLVQHQLGPTKPAIMLPACMQGISHKQ